MEERSPRDKEALTSFMETAARQRERTPSSSPVAEKASTAGKGQAAAEPCSEQRPQPQPDGSPSIQILTQGTQGLKSKGHGTYTGNLH